MAVLHTGQGFYKDAGIGFDPAEFVKQVGNDQVKLEQYRQQLQMQQEQEFLKMTSVDMENLVFEQFQLEGKKMYDKFVEQNTQIRKGKKGILSTEDKMNIISSQKDIQGRVNTMKSKAQQFIEVKDTLAKDGGYRYDEWLMKEEMDAFVKDPLNNPVPTLKARPVDLVQHMIKDAPKWVPNAREKKVEIGKGQYERFMESYRFGIENEEDLRAWAKEKLNKDQTAGYSFSSPYWERNFEGLIEQLKPEMLPYEFERTSISSSYYFGSGGGGKGTIGYSNTYDAQLGETINITGNLAPFTLNIEGERKKVNLRSIGEKGILVDYIETVPDKSKTGLDLSKSTNPALEAGTTFQISADKVVQAEDGLWYPTKTESRDRVIGKDDAELGQYYEEIEKAIKAGKNTNSEGFLKSYGIFKGNVGKNKKAVTSQPKKEEKKKGVQGSFFN